MNLETKITIYKFTPQVFTFTQKKLIILGQSEKTPGNKSGKQRIFALWQASYLSRQILTASIPFAPRSRSNVTILPSLTSVTTLFT